jgi:hypothetical protein|eukprot:Stramenopile-MAST_4_protein_4219
MFKTSAKTAIFCIFCLVIFVGTFGVRLGQTKVLASINVNLYETTLNDITAQTIEVKEGEAISQTAALFCASVGALSMDCRNRISNGLSAAFQERMETELLFDLIVTNRDGKERQFLYFSSDTVNDSIYSFFSAYPDMPSDETSVALLFKAVNQQLATIQAVAEEEAAKEIIEENSKESDQGTHQGEESSVSYLVVGDHCKNFKDVHACRMELMYGPTQLIAMEKHDDAPVPKQGGSMQYVIGVVAAMVFVFQHFWKKTKSADTLSCVVERSDVDAPEEAHAVFSTKKLVEISSNRAAKLESLVEKSKKTKVNIYSEDKENAVGNIAFNPTSPAPKFVHKITKTPLRTRRSSRRNQVNLSSPLMMR